MRHRMVAFCVAAAGAAVSAALMAAAAIPAAAAPAIAAAPPARAASAPLTRDPGVRLPSTRLPHLPVAAAVTTPNWSGYAAVADPHAQLRYVRADFTVPAVNCSRSPVGSSGYAYVGHWVGLDGYKDGTVEQTGVDAYCDASGAATYDAWYGMYPDNSVVYAGVSPGDAITASVYWNGSAYSLSCRT